MASQGFKSYTARAVVNISQSTTVDAQLSVAGADNITVDVAAPTLQVETTQNGRTVSGETIRQLPLPSRTFQQLLAPVSYTHLTLPTIASS